MHQRGFVYAMALGFVVFITILSASILMQGMLQESLSQRSGNQGESLHLADGGVDQALINLRTTDPSDDVMTRTMAGGTFTVLSVVPVVPGTQRVTVRGTAGGETRDVEAIITQVPQSVFQFALFGSQQINVSGNASTDSYDSRSGAYSDATAGHDGDIGTNTTTPGGVTIGGSIFVDGQVAVGPNVADPTSVVTGYNPAFITGTPTVVSQSDVFPMPVVNPANDGVNIQTQCPDQTVNGQTTVTLTSTGGINGTNVYCFHDLKINGGGVFTASGPVKIYLTGALKASGNSSIGADSDPTRMAFLLNSSSGATLEEGTITGSTLFYGAVYGPGSTINISGNAKVFGSIVGKTISVTGNAEIHYDEAMTTVTNVSNLYRTAVVSWRDL